MKIETRDRMPEVSPVKNIRRDHPEKFGAVPAVAAIIIAFSTLLHIGCSSSESNQAATDAADMTTPTDSSDLADAETRDGFVGPVCRPASTNLANFTGEVSFEINRDTALDRHVTRPTERDLSGLGYGPGGALIDYDLDGRVDVFLGRREASGTDPCLYRNVSDPGEVSFAVTRCFPELGEVLGARTIDMNADDQTDLLLYPGEKVYALTELPELTTIEIADFTEEDTARPNGCQITAVQVPYSARDSVVVMFGPGQESENGCRPVIVSPSGDGGWVYKPWDVTPFRPQILSVGYWDVNRDGIFDELLITDTFSSEETKITSQHPGGALLNRIPGSSLKPRYIPWITGDPRAWGSFMGAAALRIGQTQTLVLTDWGSPLVLSADARTDIAEDVGLDLSGDPFAFSWSGIVADFNLDERSDILLTRGTVFARFDEDMPEKGDESDLLLLQSESGEFEDVTAVSGLLSHPPAYSDGSEEVHYSRAGLVTDFDSDGRLDVLILPFEGRPPLYEASAATHCMADLRSPYAADAHRALGWSWIDSEGLLHHLRVDGHARLGEPLLQPVPAGVGALRSPIGARIEYTCAPGDTIVIEEPAWATIADGELRMELCDAGFGGRVVQTRPMGTSTLDLRLVDPDAPTSVPITAEGIDVFVDGRFSLRCSPTRGCWR